MGAESFGKRSGSWSCRGGFSGEYSWSLGYDGEKERVRKTEREGGLLRHGWRYFREHLLAGRRQRRQSKEEAFLGTFIVDSLLVSTGMFYVLFPLILR